MRSALLAGTVAAAVAAVILLSGMAALPPNSLSRGAIGAPSRTAVIPASGGDLASALSALPGVTNAQYDQVLSLIASYTPAQRALFDQSVISTRENHTVPSAAVMRALGFSTLGYNLYCVGASTVAGAVTGGALASVAPGIGTVLGAITGGVVGLVLGLDGCEDAAVSANAGGAEAWATAEAGAYGNEVNASAAKYQSILSVLNLTQNGWAAAADNAALSQLGNSSFNYPLDELQSGMLAQLAPIWTSYATELGYALTSLAAEVNGHLSTGSVFGGSGVTTVGNPNPLSVGTGTASLFNAGAGWTSPTQTTAVDVFVPKGAMISSTGQTLEFHNVLNGGRTGWYNYSFSGGSLGYANATFGGPTSLYNLTATTALNTVLIQDSQVNIGTPPSTTSFATFYVVQDDGNAFVDGYASPPSYGFSWSGGQTYKYATFKDWVSATSAYVNLGQDVARIEYEASANAEAYWQFLKGLGFNSAQSIPSDCYIPAPYLVLPTGLLTENWTASQWESMYLSTLASMGRFYNVTLSDTSFCGTHPHKAFHLGGSIWGNLFINATGYVYLTNGTTPVNPSGATLATEEVGAPTTWAIGNYTGDCAGNFSTNCKGPQQLILMPELQSISIPTGVRWEVPYDNPIQVYDVQAGLMLQLDGNGSGVAAPCSSSEICPTASGFHNSTPGDMVYLTSCVVNGVPSTNCTITVQTLNVTVEKYNCNGACNTSAPGGGWFAGIPNPLSALANWLSSLVGGGPLGQFLGSLLSGLILVAVILVGVYIVYVLLTSWGNRRRARASENSGTV